MCRQHPLLTSPLISLHVPAHLQKSSPLTRLHRPQWYHSWYPRNCHHQQPHLSSLNDSRHPSRHSHDPKTCGYFRSVSHSHSQIRVNAGIRGQTDCWGIFINRHLSYYGTEHTLSEWGSRPNLIWRTSYRRFNARRGFWVITCWIYTFIQWNS